MSEVLSQEQLNALPEWARKQLEQASKKNVHTIAEHGFGGTEVNPHVTCIAKVGESGRVITLQARKGTEFVQGQRPSIQLRPAAIDAMRPFLGSIGEWLGQYLDDAREQGLIDDSRE